jgi:hypothetical protein
MRYDIFGNPVTATTNPDNIWSRRSAVFIGFSPQNAFKIQTFNCGYADVSYDLDKN